MDLIELSLSSKKFTWYRNNSASRIDRVFIDPIWLENFKDLKLWGLKRSISDHCPLLIYCETKDWGPKPFKSLDAWFSNPHFIRMVKSEWKALGNLPINAKLKALKKPIKKWNRDVFGNIDRRIEELEPG